MLRSEKIALNAILCFVAMVFAAGMASAQTNREFDALLNAYAKAASNLEVYKGSSEFSEEIYWREQYYFYRSKVEKALEGVANAAQEDPRAYCLQALRMAYRFSDVDSRIMLLGELGSLYSSYEYGRQLSNYCSRYGIRYHPFNEQM